MAKETTKETAPDLRQFTQDFFTFFGATVKIQGRKKQGPLAVQLPPELTEHFGKAELTLAFQQSELTNGYDLIAHGSRTFDRMMTLLEQRGAFTLQRLPSRFSGGEELLRAVRPVNAGIAGLKMAEQMQLLFVFNWRITYRADDKREEIYTVALDESGARFAQLGEAKAGETALDIATLLADAEVVPPEKDEEGNTLPPKLPALTQVVRLAETARKYAIYHADLRCVTHEAEILPRLHRVLTRLSTYYQQQIEEVYESHDADGEKRRTLELDLQRKQQEEIENHRLRVNVQLFSYALLQVPVAVADIALSDGKREATLRVRRNRYNGALRRPTCHACGQETTDVALDRNGHLSCDACIRQCATCQEILCATCGVVACPVCAKANCDQCGRACWACGERACSEHSSLCPTCNDEICHRCQAVCAHCNVRQCRSHLRVDHVSIPRSSLRAGSHTGQSGEAELICADCAVRCPGCQQYSAHIATCEASGQRFCTNCLVTCAQCNKRVGPGFYHLAEEKPYCLECLVVCPTCNTATTTITACPTCGKAGCLHCTRHCAVSSQDFCTQHARALTCGHVIANDHMGTCHLCQSAVCPLCNGCGICERSFCHSHASECKQCGQQYCRECIRLSGLCDTCAS